MRNALWNWSVSSPAVDLRPARNPALDVVPRHVFRHFLPESLEEERALRPRPDNAHLAPQHVEELRKLVQIRAAQPAAERRNMTIVLYSPVRVRIQRRFLPHRAELDYPESPPI